MTGQVKFSYNCFSSARDKCVPVGEEMVLVIDCYVAYCATYLAAQIVYSQGLLGWFKKSNEWPSDLG